VTLRETKVHPTTGKVTGIMSSSMKILRACKFMSSSCSRIAPGRLFDNNFIITKSCTYSITPCNLTQRSKNYRYWLWRHGLCLQL